MADASKAGAKKAVQNKALQNKAVQNQAVQNKAVQANSKKFDLEGAKLRVVQVRSAIGRDGRSRGTLAALGLGRIGQSVVVTATPSVVGMIERVKSVISVEMAN